MRRSDLKPVKLRRNYVSELAKYYGLHISDETNGTLYSRRFVQCVTLGQSNSIIPLFHQKEFSSQQRTKLNMQSMDI